MMYVCVWRRGGYNKNRVSSSTHSIDRLESRSAELQPYITESNECNETWTLQLSYCTQTNRNLTDLKSCCSEHVSGHARRRSRSVSVLYVWVFHSCLHLSSLHLRQNYVCSRPFDVLLLLNSWRTDFSDTLILFGCRMLSKPHHTPSGPDSVCAEATLTLRFGLHRWLITWITRLLQCSHLMFQWSKGIWRCFRLQGLTVVFFIMVSYLIPAPQRMNPSG